MLARGLSLPLEAVLLVNYFDCVGSTTWERVAIQVVAQLHWQYQPWGMSASATEQVMKDCDFKIMDLYRYLLTVLPWHKLRPDACSDICCAASTLVRWLSMR